MESQEYERLATVELQHWFYRGKRAIVRHYIQRYRPLGPDDLLIDAGTGTGLWPYEMSRYCRVVGLDDHEESVALARPRLASVGGTLIQTSLENIVWPSNSASVVTALDVLEHLDHDDLALRELARITAPGGLLIITVPALMWLWSDWDVVLHHRRRYSKRQLKQLVSLPELELLHLAYINGVALLPIVMVRWWRKWFPPQPGRPRAEDRIPPGWLNRLLYAMFVYPACWGWPFPLGVSLLAVLRKR
ncbi:MAG: type 11 methyltransferase [Planctomycetaceae bacterium]|nr:MAG: type 11 methyltransferase [Planctomycetaceae bacterium]